MVALIPKSQIQGFNVDTVEKALVFGALALRAALVGSDNSNAEDLAVSINVSAIDRVLGNLNLEIYLPYTAYGLNTNGGQLLGSILEYDSHASNLENDLNLGSLPSLSGLTIPDYDDSVITSFEKYLVYYAQILWASVANKRDNAISLTFLGNQDNSQVLISLNLPLDLNQWLLGGNYLNAISTVVTAYVDPNSPDNGGGSQEQIVNYSVFYEDMSVNTLFELHTVTNIGVLEQITIDADYDTDTGILDTYFYLNGEEIYSEEVIDYGDGTYDIVFDTLNDPVFLNPGDLIEFDLYEEPAPTYMDINIYINEPPAQP